MLGGLWRDVKGGDATGGRRDLVKTIQRLREDLGPEEGRRIQTRDDGYEALG